MAVTCARPADPAPRCEGCGLTARAMVHRASRRCPDPRLRVAWSAREVWSALAAAGADLEIVWLLPAGRGFRQARLTAIFETGTRYTVAVRTDLIDPDTGAIIPD